MDNLILELQDVTKNFAGHRAVDGISLSVARGQTIALLGASGCGKTTTLRMIAGFLSPDSGTIRIGGRDMKGVRPYERKVGLVFQDYALFPHLTVGQNISYGLRQRGLGRDEIAAKVDAMCRLVRLQGFEARRPAELSGGQQQRVALARAMAIDPELLLLDEPLSALDAKLRQELRLELKQILQTTNCTSLIVTHDQEEAMSLADHVVVMHQGRLLQQGPPTSIYDVPETKLVADFIGRTNWFDGSLDAFRSDGLAAFTTADGCFSVLGRAELAGKRCQLCVRPERLVVLRSHEEMADANLLQGRLVDAAFLGKETHYVIELVSGRTVLAVEPARNQAVPPLNGAIRLGFRPADCILISA